MSKNILLKLQDDIFKETERITKKTNMARNLYINRAVAFYNMINKKLVLRQDLAKDSKLVRENSMEELDIYESLEDELEDFELS